MLSTSTIVKLKLAKRAALASERVEAANPCKDGTLKPHDLQVNALPNEFRLGGWPPFGVRSACPSKFRSNRHAVRTV